MRDLEIVLGGVGRASYKSEPLGFVELVKGHRGLKSESGNSGHKDSDSDESLHKSITELEGAGNGTLAN